MAAKLSELLADLKEDEAIAETKARIAAKEDPMIILEDSRAGMEVVGKRFASGEYFIPDLIYSGRT
jgi:methanogenic corrinoid protein MtbC1